VSGESNVTNPDNPADKPYSGAEVARLVIDAVGT
jgi:hypothetical protein